MNYPLLIARRIGLGGNGQHSSPAVRVATAAVALSVAVMMLSIAVVQGFKKEIINRVIGFNSHISLYADRLSTDDDNIVTLTTPLAELLDSVPQVKSYSLQAVAPAILKTDSDFKGIYMRSLSSPSTLEFLNSNLVAGSLPSSPDSINDEEVIISSRAAAELHLKPGDRIDTYFITDEVRARPLKVTAVFNTHFDSYDNVLAYCSLPLIQQIGSLQPYQGTSLQINLEDFSQLPSAYQQLSENMLKSFASGHIPRPYRLETALTQGAVYFRWLDLLDTNTLVIIILMTVVAAVTLISGMLIIILDKKTFIGLMRALGTPGRKLRQIFIFLALRVALTGIFAGTIAAGILLIIQHMTHAVPLDPESYYMDFVPVSISWADILLLDLGAIIVSFIVLIVPSILAARIDPAQTLSGAD